MVKMVTCFCFVNVSSVKAGLVWSQKTIELCSDAQSKELTAQFKFENQSNTAVDISHVESSCGCTTAILRQQHFEPGQFGEITATFAVGDRTGLQKKTIAVTTSGSANPTILTLIVHIPEALHIQPTSISWKHGEKNMPKSISVEVAQDTPLRDFTMQSSNPKLLTEVHTIQEGRKYRIDITPAGTDQNLFATLTVHGFFGKVEKTFHAYASVQAATATND